MDTPTPPPIDPDAPQPPPRHDLPLSQWKVILHLSGLAGVPIPGAGIVAPVVIWLLKKDAYPALDPEGRKVVNFQISYFLYIVVAGLIATALSCLGVPFLFPAAVYVVWLVFTIIGTVKTSNGVDYQFPFVIKML